MTRPYRLRPSAAALDAAFETYKGLDSVRTAHALWVEAAIGLLRVAHGLEALGESRWASAIEGMVVMVEQQATRHVYELAARAAANGGGHG